MTEERSGGWSGPEQRRHRRVPLGVPITCSAGSTERAGTAENISVSGLLVRMQSTFPQDEQLTIVFTLPGATDPISAQVRVAHVVPDVFLGLEFSGISPDAQTSVEQYIQNNGSAEG